MRTTLTILIVLTVLSTRAQSHLPIGGYAQWQPYSFFPDSSNSTHKWQLRQFASLSAGYIFGNGGSVSYLSAPVGMALIRPLTKNVSAFGAVTVSPTLFSINRLYTDPAINQGNNFSRPYNLGLNARVEGGFIYTNDAKTFSISGSVGIEKGSYPVYYTPNRTTTRKQ